MLVFNNHRMMSTAATYVSSCLVKYVVTVKLRSHLVWCGDVRCVACFVVFAATRRMTSQQIVHEDKFAYCTQEVVCILSSDM